MAHSSSRILVRFKPTLVLLVGILTCNHTLALSWAEQEIEEKRKSQDPFEGHLSELVLANETILAGAARLTENIDIGVSVELPLAPDLKKEAPRLRSFTTTLKPGTLTELLNALCKLDPSFSWSRHGNIVNLFPSAAADDTNYVLNQRLAVLNLRNVTDAEQGVFDAVAQLPGPRVQLAVLQVGPSLKFPKPWTATLRNLTLREALNHIARQLGPTYGWQFTGSQEFRFVMFHKRLRPGSRKDRS